MNIIGRFRGFLAALSPSKLLHIKLTGYMDKIKEMAHILKPNGEIEYEAEVKGKDVLFDKDGKFLSKEK